MVFRETEAGVEQVEEDEEFNELDDNTQPNGGVQGLDDSISSDDQDQNEEIDEDQLYDYAYKHDQLDQDQQFKENLYDDDDEDDEEVEGDSL